MITIHVHCHVFWLVRCWAASWYRSGNGPMGLGWWWWVREINLRRLKLEGITGCGWLVRKYVPSATLILPAGSHPPRRGWGKSTIPAIQTAKAMSAKESKWGEKRARSFMLGSYPWENSQFGSFDLSFKVVASDDTMNGSNGRLLRDK